MRRSREKYRDLQLFRQDVKTGNMVAVFMGDEYGGKRTRILTENPHAFEGFAARNSCVYQYLRPRGLDHGAVATATAGQHRNRHTHKRRIRVVPVESGVSFWLAETSVRKHSFRVYFAASMFPIARRI